VGSQKTVRAVCTEVVRILAEERQKQAISKYILSARSGVSQQMIGYVERGVRNPSLETVVRLAQGLEIDLPDLFRRARNRVS
jgi:transcriptional regulator with XRE-family HTH domain